MRPTLLLALLVALAACSTPEDDSIVRDDQGRVVDNADDDLFSQRPDPSTPQGEEGETPPTWTVRFDDPSAQPTVGADSTADVFFVNMTPGWHITTGPAGIFYHPASTAEGQYRVESKLHLFDPGERLEAYGLFIGGRDLTTDSLRYDYFLLRNSGEFLIKRRTGGTTETIQDWTASDAIVRFDETSDTNVTNTLAVEIREAERVYGTDGTHIDAPALVVFSVNGTPVARMPADSLHTDGVVGLRVNHALNLHIETLEVSEL